MTTMLQTFVHQEDTARVSFGDGQSTTTGTADINACLIARIGWCHRQVMRAVTAREAEEWSAEKQGLIDAFLGRDCRYEYELTPVLQERYVMGLEDGTVLKLAARIRPTCGHRYDGGAAHF